MNLQPHLSWLRDHPVALAASSDMSLAIAIVLSLMGAVVGVMLRYGGMG
ncbi:hypothetical protein [Phenylobacterium montanum]|uniref:Uncharacterized protein n=1 Tax=Phenylobacterium montanum TaxID=2823693 RepID=A0A975G0G2_9CAUL|nr:hypothetical protein [Caulobacter sp. S6]QUD87686.1 hypothetical protein KCG34_21990 [Caulobacter sp. S6]